MAASFPPSVQDYTLLAAIDAGDLQAVTALLAAGVRVGFYDGNTWPPLLHAAKGDVAIVRALLDAGADPDAHDDSGYLPLQMALSVENYAAAEALLAAGADINAQKGDRRMSPLHAAVFSCNARKSTGAIRFLLDRGADPSLVMNWLHHVDVTPEQVAAQLDAQNGDTRLADFFARCRRDENNANAHRHVAAKLRVASGKYRLKP